jgi:hypothetical protein
MATYRHHPVLHSLHHYHRCPLACSVQLPKTLSGWLSRSFCAIEVQGFGVSIAVIVKDSVKQVWPSWWLGLSLPPPVVLWVGLSTTKTRATRYETTMAQPNLRKDLGYVRVHVLHDRIVLRELEHTVEKLVGRVARCSLSSSLSSVCAIARSTRCALLRLTHGMHTERDG